MENYTRVVYCYTRSLNKMPSKHHPFFSGPYTPIIYTKDSQNLNFGVETIREPRFSAEDLVSRASKTAQTLSKGQSNTLLEVGGTFLNIMFEGGTYPDFLVLTELEPFVSTEVSSCIDYARVTSNYQLVHKSPKETTEHGVWEFCVWKSNYSYL